MNTNNAAIRQDLIENSVDHQVSTLILFTFPLATSLAYGPSHFTERCLTIVRRVRNLLPLWVRLAIVAQTTAQGRQLLSSY
jgi:hypothetical protein